MKEPEPLKEMTDSRPGAGNVSESRTSCDVRTQVTSKMMGSCQKYIEINLKELPLAKSEAI